MDALLQLDHQLFAFINSGCRDYVRHYLDIPFYIITLFGTFYLLVLLSLSLFWFYDRARFFKNTLFLILLLSLTGLTSSGLKYLIQRHRPLVESKNLKIIKQVHVVGEWLGNYSFPSGHAIAAFTAATFMAFVFPKWTLLFLLGGLIVGFSRIYIGVHFPLDVLAGALIGGLLTLLFLRLGQKYFLLTDKEIVARISPKKESPGAGK